MSAAWKFRGNVPATVSAVSSIAFDPQQELLWIGDTYGNLMSFTASLPHSERLSWRMYSLFHAAREPIRSISFVNDGNQIVVAAASQSSVRTFKRGGTPQLLYDVSRAGQNRLDLFAVDVASTSGVLYFTGDNGLTRLRYSKWAESVVSNTVALEEGTVTAMKATQRWVITGCIGGNLVIRDAETLVVLEIKRLSANRVQAMDTFGNMIVAAFLERTTTSFVKVFNVEDMREPVITINDIPTGNVLQLCHYEDRTSQLADAAKSSSGGSSSNNNSNTNNNSSSSDAKACLHRAFVLEPHGFHIIQLDRPAPVYSSARVEDGAYTCVAVSPNGLCSSIGNDKGHLISLSPPSMRTDFFMTNTCTVAPTASLPVFTQSWEENKEGKTEAFFDESCRTKDLVSNWPPPEYMILETPTRTRALNVPTGVPHENRWGFTRSDAYLEDAKDKLASILPNPFPFNTELGDNPLEVQRLLLELRKHMKRSIVRSRGDTRNAYSQQDEALQVCYGAHYNRFDWKSYNDLPRDVIGLDNSYPECWLNSLLQSLYLCQPPEFPVRKVLMRHVCAREYCVTCEVSIIFSNMLMTARYEATPIVQMQSLIRTMYQIPSIVNTGIFVKPVSRDDAVAKMHLAQRVLLETFHADLQYQKEHPFLHYREPSPDYTNSIANFFGTEFTSNGRNHIQPRFLWEVPASALKVDEGLQHLLKQLETYKEQVQIKRLPPIIVLLLNPEHGNLRPPTSLKISRSQNEEYSYGLCSNVLHIADDTDDTGIFVSHQRVRDDLFSLVNDYRVTAALKEEQQESLIPPFCNHSAVVTMYALDNLQSPPYAIGENRPPKMFDVLSPLLLNDVFAGPLQPETTFPSVPRFITPLHSAEVIVSGDLVAIDAEYVVLDWPSKTYGDTLEYLAQQRKRFLGLARVSCILSSRPGEETTIIDDYVHIPEKVKDYVTMHSGIHPGDLDPKTSSKNLTALKATYLKLRALVDRGVRFVGHGLQQDFRVCNITVPPDQIIDTLEIFHRRGARYLSLRYLAYHVLGERVQEDEHDSIEDARTALRLYRKYEQLKAEGTFENVLSSLMVKGAETSWHVPDGRISAYEAFTSPTLLQSPIGNEEDDGYPSRSGVKDSRGSTDAAIKRPMVIGNSFPSGGSEEAAAGETMIASQLRRHASGSSREGNYQQMLENSTTTSSTTGMRNLASQLADEIGDYVSPTPTTTTEGGAWEEEEEDPHTHGKKAVGQAYSTDSLTQMRGVDELASSEGKQASEGFGEKLHPTSSF